MPRQTHLLKKCHDCPARGLNPGPLRYKHNALPTELAGLKSFFAKKLSLIKNFQALKRSQNTCTRQQHDIKQGRKSLIVIKSEKKKVEKKLRNF